MPTPKQTSDQQTWKGGINENIGPSQYANGLYSVMDNIKLDISGKLKRDKGFNVLNTFAGNAVPGMNILYSGIQNVQVGNAADDPIHSTSVLVKQDNVSGLPQISIGSVPGFSNIVVGFQDLFDGWAARTAPNYSWNEIRTINALDNIYILGGNGGETYPLLKTDMLQQVDLSNTLTNTYAAASAYFDISTFQPDVANPAVGATFPPGQPAYLAVGQYGYRYSLVTNSGIETELSEYRLVEQITGTYGNCVPLRGFIQNWSFLFGPPVSSTIKSLRIYRTHSSFISDGFSLTKFDNQGNDLNLYWFVAEIPLNANFFSSLTPSSEYNSAYNGFGYSAVIFQDWYPDAQLIAAYQDMGMVTGYGEFGLYLNSILHIGGNKAYPNVVYLSTPGTDGFEAQNVTVIPHADASNPVIAISYIQNVVFVFNQKFGICRLLPNIYAIGQNLYTLYPVSEVYGCDSPDSCLNCGGQIYFVFNNHLYSFDGATVLDIGIPIQPTLDLSGVPVKLTYNTKKEYLYVNVRDANYHGIKTYCWSIRHKHFTTESLDYQVLGDKLNTIDDIYFDKHTDLNIFSITHGTNQAWMLENQTYTIPGLWDTANPTTLARQATIVKPLAPATQTMLNKLTLFGNNPAIFNALGNWIASGMQMQFSTDGVNYGSIFDASIGQINNGVPVNNVRRGADLRINKAAETFYLMFLWNTPNPAMVLAAIPGLEAILDYWTHTSTPMSATARQLTTGRLIQ